ncbi:hypothetical protein VFPBJ_10304 [Purpureocillium lilacinum]|uniref:Uncharacterized protein n=1 Tax=Purpureocillium lilacinum TaxID=33203 RepID=A0A179G0U8_PURLI|nr:hypothetical protein VFPBJ_10304 [Purpureocillium lilacinum]
MAYKDLPHPSDMNDSTPVSMQEAAMKFLKCLAAVASLSLVTLALVAPRAGYQVANLSAEYQITPGGPSVVLDGTVQEARAQLLRLNPNWDSDFRRARELGSSALTKRNMWDGADVSCENRWGAVRPDAIKDGIKYLRGVEGKPSMGPGPGVCARDRSLTATTTIQNRDPKILDSFADIADGAARAQEVCADKDERDEDLVNWWAGQAFHRTNWNVIVARC